MAMPTFPQQTADYVGGLDDLDFDNGGHITHFLATAQGALSFADFCRLMGIELLALAEQVSTDAASAAAGSGTEVTIEQIWAGGAAQYVSIRRVIAANAPVALTDAPSIAVDLNAGINFTLAIGGDRSLANPTNAVAGKSGIIIVTQDATGGRGLAKASNWKVAGGELAIDQAPGAKSVLAYYVESPTSILLTVAEGFA